LRLLVRVARVTPSLATAIVERFGELAKLQRATIEGVVSVLGVDFSLAESIKDTLDRLTETSILDQYH
jgi:diadenylate cyclase